MVRFTLLSQKQHTEIVSLARLKFHSTVLIGFAAVTERIENRPKLVNAIRHNGLARVHRTRELDHRRRKNSSEAPLVRREICQELGKGSGTHGHSGFSPAPLARNRMTQ